MDGFNEVNVNPVTASIDGNIKAGNIKKDITILGVTGTLEFTTEDLSVTPSTLIQTFTPTADGFNRVTVNAVTHQVDANIQPENIKQGITILGKKRLAGKNTRKTILFASLQKSAFANRARFKK